MIVKNLFDTFTLMDDLFYSEFFTVEGGPGFLQNRNISLTKSDKQFNISFQFSYEERAFLNNVLDTQPNEFKIISNGNKEYILPDKSTLLTKVREINDATDFEVSGSVTQISSVSISEFDNKYHRIIIPILHRSFSLYEYEHYVFDTPLNKNIKNKQLIKVSIKGYEFHFFTFKLNDKTYWAIDSLQTLDFKKFQQIAYSIFNTHGFIEGDLHLDEAYYFASDSIEFNDNIEIFFSAIRSSLITGYGMITCNPYSIYVPFYKSRSLQVDTEYIKSWSEKLIAFEATKFSKLAELLYEYDSINRAVLIVLEANNQPLELKAASYCVAFEAICHTIKKHFGIDSTSVIDNNVFSNHVKPQFLELLSQLEGDLVLTAGQRKILSKKLDNWNQPTNADSLTAPFKKYGYDLSKDEFKCVDNRNKFLHGSLPVDERNEDKAFKELYHISMTIHKLLYVLVFRIIDYEGYIINYPMMHTNITGRHLEEELLIKIGPKK